MSFFASIPYTPLISLFLIIVSIFFAGVYHRYGMVSLLFVVAGINIGVYWCASILSYTYYRSIINKGIIHENKFINPQGYAFMTALINIILLTLIYGFIYAMARFGYLFKVIYVEDFYGVFYNPALFAMIGLPLIFITIATAILGIYMYRNKTFENKHDPIKVIKILRNFSEWYSLYMYLLFLFPMWIYYSKNKIAIEDYAITQILKEPNDVKECFTKINKRKLRNRRQEELRQQINKLIKKHNDTIPT